MVYKAEMVALDLDGEELIDNERANKANIRKIRADIIAHFNIVKKIIGQAREERECDKQKARKEVSSF